MVSGVLFDLGKIVQGAANGDWDRVMAYGSQLADRLEAEGEAGGAKRLREILSQSKARTFTLARAGGPGTPHAPPIPIDGESRMPMADEERPPAGQVELFLPAPAEKVVSHFLSCHRAADRLIACGVGVSASMLIYGPPGCGKTQLARFISSELGLPLLTARVDGLISSYLGSTAKNLRALFEHAGSRPCVLFLDEFDALAKLRDDARELGELKRVVISLLQNIDALGQDHVLLAASNHEHLLDRAVWRRFAYKLHLAEPGEPERKCLATAFFRGLADEPTIELVTLLGAGMTGAQVRTAAETAIRTSVLSGADRVSPKDAVESFLAVNPATASLAAAPLHERVKAVRGLSPKLMTQARLAEAFQVSQATISRLLKEVGNEES